MRYKEDEFREIVLKSNSYSEVTRKLGLKTSYGNRQTVKKYVDLYGININHFGNYRSGGNRKKIPLENILVTGSTYNTRDLKKRLVTDELLEYKCVKCNNEGEWMGEKIVLQLDHINGINNDNRLENLRFLCPNCHSQTITYGGKNLKLKANKRIEYCKCGNTKCNTSKVCKVCDVLQKRTISRPTYDVLVKEIKELGYVGTGKKYSVSDNSIRKWKKFYEKNMV